MLREINLKDKNKNEYPYSVFQEKLQIKINSPITFFVGENGSGKSTLLESLALKTSLPTVGASSTNQDNSLTNLHDFAKNIKLSWDVITHKGFFLRAEDFFGFTKYLKILEMELNELKDGYNQNLSGYGRDLATASMQSQINSILKRYGDLNAVSHGQGFLKLFEERLIPNGLYLLDEPEAALSPVRQLSLISLIKQMTAKNCQFIIATHSPILLSFQPAQILQFDNQTIKEISKKDIKHINLTKSILNNPDIYFSKL